MVEAVQVKDLFEKMIFASTANFREIVRASIPRSDVTPADAKATEVIWDSQRLVWAKDLYEKMIFPSPADFREIVRASIPGCDVTPADVKTAKVIWGWSPLKMKGNTVRRNAKPLAQSDQDP
jgi:hypothetical protein